MLDANHAGPETAWTTAAQARFDQLNAQLAARTRHLLDKITADQDTHARLLNTLSMLEHMGSHKIMATQHGAAIDQSTLRHVAEEAHHAYFMKRQAEKTAQRDLHYKPDDLLAAPSARIYFQRLEVAIVNRIGASGPTTAVYLLMSMIIEFRALWFYRLYQETLTRAGLPISLKRILGEEQHHLSEMADRLMAIEAFDEDQVSAFVAIENRLYQRMLSAIERAAADSLGRRPH